MKNLAPVVLIVIFFSWLAACSEADCVSQTSNYVNVTFYNSEENEEDTVRVDTLRAVGSDVLIMADSPTLNTITSFILPLNPGDTQSTFVFIRGAVKDTLSLGYKTGSRLISEDCGTEVIISDLKSLKNDFDSIRIINTILTESPDEDIRLYN